MAGDFAERPDQENPGRRSSDGVSRSVDRIGERRETVRRCRNNGHVSIAASGDGR